MASGLLVGSPQGLEEAHLQGIRCTNIEERLGRVMEQVPGTSKCSGNFLLTLGGRVRTASVQWVTLCCHRAGSGTGHL